MDRPFVLTISGIKGTRQTQVRASETESEQTAAYQKMLVDLLYPIQLESERLISAKPALAADYEVGSISLYRNARREGVAV